MNLGAASADDVVDRVLFRAQKPQAGLGMETLAALFPPPLPCRYSCPRADRARSRQARVAREWRWREKALELAAQPRQGATTFLEQIGHPAVVEERQQEVSNSMLSPLATVGLADAPSHLIHFNGERFLGPHTH